MDLPLLSEIDRSRVASAGDGTDLLRCMLTIRAFEEKIISLTAGGNFPGTCTSVGQEAAATGAIRALTADDFILTNHRSAGHLLARGADPGRLLAEIMGRADGYCRGRSGSLHVSAKELGVILTSTIVGGELSLATGVGLSLKMGGAPGVVACLFGDGAACEGVFHESLNLAATWGLPVLYLCENNQWQAYVRRDETMLTERIADRAAAYGIAGRTVDGNDVEAVLAATREARAEVLASGRPMLLELATYRMRGHYEPDDMAYVDADELAAWAVRDAIGTQKARLLADGSLDDAAVAALEQQAETTIAAALAFAEASPHPDPAELTADVYA